MPGAAQATAVITDAAEDAPSFTFAVSGDENALVEGADENELTLSSSVKLQRALTFTLSVPDDDNDSNSRIADGALPKRVTIPAGEDSVTFPVTVANNEDLDGAANNFEVNAKADESNQRPGLIGDGLNGRAVVSTITIADDERVGFALSGVPETLAEGDQIFANVKTDKPITFTDSTDQATKDATVRVRVEGAQINTGGAAGEVGNEVSLTMVDTGGSILTVYNAAGTATSSGEVTASATCTPNQPRLLGGTGNTVVCEAFFVWPAPANTGETAGVTLFFDAANDNLGGGDQEIRFVLDFVPPGGTGEISGSATDAGLYDTSASATGSFIFEDNEVGLRFGEGFSDLEFSEGTEVTIPVALTQALTGDATFTLSLTEGSTQLIDASENEFTIAGGETTADVKFTPKGDGKLNLEDRTAVLSISEKSGGGYTANANLAGKNVERSISVANADKAGVFYESLTGVSGSGNLGEVAEGVDTGSVYTVSKFTTALIPAGTNTPDPARRALLDSAGDIKVRVADPTFADTIADSGRLVVRKGSTAIDFTKTDDNVFSFATDGTVADTLTGFYDDTLIGGPGAGSLTGLSPGVTGSAYGDTPGYIPYPKATIFGPAVDAGLVETDFEDGAFSRGVYITGDDTGANGDTASLKVRTYKPIVEGRASGSVLGGREAVPGVVGITFTPTGEATALGADWHTYTQFYATYDSGSGNFPNRGLTPKLLNTAEAAAAGGNCVPTTGLNLVKWNPGEGPDSDGHNGGVLTFPKGGGAMTACFSVTLRNDGLPGDDISDGTNTFFRVEFNRYGVKADGTVPTDNAEISTITALVTDKPTRGDGQVIDGDDGDSYAPVFTVRAKTGAGASDITAEGATSVSEGDLHARTFVLEYGDFPTAIPGLDAGESVTFGLTFFEVDPETGAETQLTVPSTYSSGSDSAGGIVTANGEALVIANTGGTLSFKLADDSTVVASGDRIEFVLPTASLKWFNEANPKPEPEQIIRVKLSATANAGSASVATGQAQMSVADDDAVLVITSAPTSLTEGVEARIDVELQGHNGAPAPFDENGVDYILKLLVDTDGDDEFDPTDDAEVINASLNAGADYAVEMTDLFITTNGGAKEAKSVTFTPPGDGEINLTAKDIQLVVIPVRDTSNTQIDTRPGSSGAARGRRGNAQSPTLALANGDRAVVKILGKGVPINRANLANDLSRNVIAVTEAAIFDSSNAATAEAEDRAFKAALFLIPAGEKESNGRRANHGNDDITITFGAAPKGLASIADSAGLIYALDADGGGQASLVQPFKSGKTKDIYFGYDDTHLGGPGAGSKAPEGHDTDAPYGDIAGRWDNPPAVLSGPAVEAGFIDGLPHDAWAETIYVGPFEGTPTIASAENEAGVFTVAVAQKVREGGGEGDEAQEARSGILEVKLAPASSNGYEKLGADWRVKLTATSRTGSAIRNGLTESNGGALFSEGFPVSGACEPTTGDDLVAFTQEGLSENEVVLTFPKGAGEAVLCLSYGLGPETGSGPGGSDGGPTRFEIALEYGVKADNTAPGASEYSKLSIINAQVENPGPSIRAAVEDADAYAPDISAITATGSATLAERSSPAKERHLAADRTFTATISLESDLEIPGLEDGESAVFDLNVVEILTAEDGTETTTQAAFEASGGTTLPALSSGATTGIGSYTISATDDGSGGLDLAHHVSGVTPATADITLTITMPDAVDNTATDSGAPAARNETDFWGPNNLIQPNRTFRLTATPDSDTLNTRGVKVAAISADFTIEDDDGNLTLVAADDDSLRAREGTARNLIARIVNPEVGEDFEGIGEAVNFTLVLYDSVGDINVEDYADGASTSTDYIVRGTIPATATEKAFTYALPYDNSLSHRRVELNLAEAATAASGPFTYTRKDGLVGKTASLTASRSLATNNEFAVIQLWEDTSAAGDQSSATLVGPATVADLAEGGDWGTIIASEADVGKRYFLPPRHAGSGAGPHEVPQSRRRVRHR